MLNGLHLFLVIATFAAGCAYGDPIPVPAQVCTPGETRCDSVEFEEMCIFDGSEWAKVECDNGATCVTDANGVGQCIIVK